MCEEFNPLRAAYYSNVHDRHAVTHYIHASSIPLGSVSTLYGRHDVWRQVTHHAVLVWKVKLHTKTISDLPPEPSEFVNKSQAQRKDRQTNRHTDRQTYALEKWTKNKNKKGWRKTLCIPFGGTWISDFRPLEPVLGKKFHIDFESARKN